MTKLNDLYDQFDQSAWIDNIRRDWLNDGTLAHLVAEGVRGVTSNPSIFAKALATSTAYDQVIRSSAHGDVEALFEHLAVGDVRDACDVLADVHERAQGEFQAGRRRASDGFVSLEVSPRLARDTEGTIEAALRLWREVGRQNLMIKIPGTREGLQAISEVLSHGVNVNVTLIFSVERYNEVISAWAEGLERARANGLDLSDIASVASFFVSRIDVAVDKLLGADDPRRGTTATAQVARAYELYRDRVDEERTRRLLDQGAQVQRPLWASTSTKDPAYDDLLYVNSIVASETVNTMPDATLAAVLEHGTFTNSLLANEESIDRAVTRLSELPADVSLSTVTDELEREGVDSFVASYEELLTTLTTKVAQAS
ncbi:MAG TPA: transaldolase [Acidimicrobiales bacterium]|nr:transaldolase [Acidimicrobiales bacterium]